MQQDIRNLFENFKDKEVSLSKHHTKKFEDLLQQELHQPKKKTAKKVYVKWMSIAASIVLLISLGWQFYPVNTIKDDPKLKDTETSSAYKEITLGNISPEFNTIEKYYVNSISLAISELELTDENEDLIDGYLIKIAELTNEYKSLTKELNTKGVNDATIDALIRNLQLRLQLLQRLKKQLKELNTLNKKQHETQV